MTVGFRTLDVGEQALVFDIKGRARVEEGPKRLFLFREKYRELRRHCADQTEYIGINHRDGHIEHKPGPCVVFENPVFHAHVRIGKGISLDANEVLVSYRADQKTLEVQRHIHYGPTLFIQQASEWLHEFVWHGRDPDSKVKKLPGRLRFNKLRVIPGQFYYNVEDVRTSDDAVITVKLMIFYELKDIEQMLNSTQDPIADFINCLSADVVAYASKLTYIEFIENSGDLNDLTRYPQTLERSAAIGYDVSKVVYRGYHADEKLQCMHNRAVAERAKLKINFEKEQQEQTLTDFQLRKEMERISTEQQMEIEATKHKHQMEKAKLQHKLALQEKEQRERIARWTADKQSEIKRHEAEDSHKLDHYRKLSGLSVNMTDYLVSLNPRPVKLVRVVAPDDSTKIHLHQN